jgi:hypothetical protein
MIEGVDIVLGCCSLHFGISEFDSLVIPLDNLLKLLFL